MKLYTSYWAMVRNFPKNLVALSTVCWKPKWKSFGKDNRGVWVLDCPPLKPGIECAGLCDGKCAIKHPKNCEFLQTYYKQLFKLDFNEFMDKLNKLHDKICEGEGLDDVDFAFIVYETPTNPCSEREAIKKWFKYYLIELKEWSKDGNGEECAIKTSI